MPVAKPKMTRDTAKQAVTAYTQPKIHSLAYDTMNTADHPLPKPANAPAFSTDHVGND
jgi:hypothetical protein